MTANSVTFTEKNPSWETCFLFFVQYIIVKKSNCEVLLQREALVSETAEVLALGLQVYLKRDSDTSVFP